MLLPLCQLQTFRKAERGTLSTLFGITYYPIAGMATLDILSVTLQIEYTRGCFELRILLPVMAWGLNGRKCMFINIKYMKVFLLPF